MWHHSCPHTPWQGCWGSWQSCTREGWWQRDFGVFMPLPKAGIIKSLSGGAWVCDPVQPQRSLCVPSSVLPALGSGAEVLQCLLRAPGSRHCGFVLVATPGVSKLQVMLLEQPLHHGPAQQGLQGFLHPHRQFHPGEECASSPLGFRPSG